MAAIAKRASLDDEGSPDILDDSPLVTELIALVKDRNGSTVTFDLTRSEATHILRWCHPSNAG